MIIVNVAAMSIGVYVYLFYFNIYPGVELLNHTAVLSFFLAFQGTCIQFSTEVSPIYIPNSVQGFPFLYILTNICFFVVFFILAILSGLK